MRKLASVQRIIKVEDIANADTLEVIHILGWRVVVRKEDNYKAGDLVIYFELDSIVPQIPEFEFMSKTDYVVKTVRLRKTLSQGLCWKTNILPPDLEVYEGMDVTSVLGVGKYEEEIPDDLVGKSKGSHPTIVRKSGEVRVQTALSLLEEFRGLDVAVTTKIEGYSSSYIHYNGVLDVCSHTTSYIEDPKNVQWQMAHKYNIPQVLSKYGNLAIQGEIAGPKIFKNPLGLDEIDLYVFRITDLDTQRRYSPEEMLDFCIENGLTSVPMEFLPNFDYDLDGVLKLAEGNYEPSGNPREGIVILPQTPVFSETLSDWLSMKVINNVYLEGSWKKKRKK